MSGQPLEGPDILEGAVVEIAGMPFRLQADDDVRADAVAALLRHAPRSTAPPRCTITFRAEAIALPDTEPTTVIDYVTMWRTEPGVLFLRSDEGLAAGASAGDITVGGDADSLLRGFRFVCNVGLTHLLAQHGRHVVHGGAVLVDDRALLIVGETGTGKSTLVFGALGLGWPALSDDMVALHRDDGVVLATGLPRPIAVPADVVTGEGPGTRLVPDDPRQRTELPGSTLAAGIHPVAGVVVTGRGSDSDTVVAPMGGQEVLRILLQASASLADPLLLPQVFAIAGAIARLPAWSLHHGTDPSLRLDGARRRLEELAAALREART